MSEFLLGVIEGFYGRPWTGPQRERLLGWMQDWSMNTYLYAPKDDLYHRARWRAPYPPAEAAALSELNAAATARGVRFVYALAPGLDLDWASDADRAALAAKFDSLAAAGLRDFALLFDDIPNQPDRAAQAAEQVETTHFVRAQLKARGTQGLFLFCPTEYCGEMATPSVTTSPYLRELARLDSGVEILWTGPLIVSPQISAESVRELAGVIGRKPLIWDNLHVSDYTIHRLHLGPYGGRPLALRGEVSGILSNPNTPFEPNFPGLHSLADYAAAQSTWSAEASGERALAAWLPTFGGVASQEATPDAVTLADLQLLADTLYLPHRLGPRAGALLTEAQAHTAAPTPETSAALQAARRAYRRILGALERGHNRELLFDLHPYLVDLSEELTRLLGEAAEPDRNWPYRGGLADKLLDLGRSRQLPTEVPEQQP
ncbi:beta-N-acetylglucosaminidase domain-containing protein [Deinococcus alpinitundrae]|uniref:beta-N-acetylglucosaminidase domain-containing protein n=1 Tax=Deinococcus alpinitundrae TaxID=468913 RepID=UPI00137A4252|nr:beta-N-acetylglucosaminidase domain-containing protein [Deinococcus alpinitundrae]